MRKELFVRAVHLGEVGHIRQEDLTILAPDTPNTKHQTSRTSRTNRTRKKTYINLDDLLHATSRSVQNSLDVITAHLGLVANRALDQVRGSVCGNLARDEDLAVCADGLGLGYLASSSSSSCCCPSFSLLLGVTL